jgi:hypothetical protein
MKALAVSLLVVSLVLHPGVGHAAWQPDGNGVAIVAGDQSVPAITPDGTGGTIITWADLRSGGYDIYAQRLNGLGVAQWTANGEALCSTPRDQVDPQIVADGSGGAVVAWKDYRNGNWDIFAQRVNGSGVMQWTADGVWLCLHSGDQLYPTIVSDGIGGAIVTWEDHRPGNPDVYAQRVNGSGVTLWTADGVGVCTAAYEQSVVETISDGSGGVIAAWQDYRISGLDNNIYAQRLNASGVAQWTVDGVAVCPPAPYVAYPQLVSSGAGGAIVVWSDLRSGDADIYAQRVDGSGVLQWTPSGVALCTAPSDQFFYDYQHPMSFYQYEQPTIAKDGAGGAFVTWGDERNNYYPDIYAQHVSFAGVVQLGPNGAALCTAGSGQDRPTITYTGPFGDAVVTWQDQRNEGESAHDVYALPVPNTPIGPYVRYVPYPNGLVPPPPRLPVHVLFHNVIGPGFTYLDITPAGPALPPSFVLGDGRYYNLSTTAGTTDNIDVCIKFDPAALQHPAAALRMFEYSPAGPAGPMWLDVTTQPAMGDSICGTSTQLGTFVIAFPSVTGVGDTPVPASFALHSNVPNPFNPITTISYDVPSPGADVSISIYDVSGRLIRSLVKAHRGAGTWSVEWNGDNDRGQSVASGVYFYRMKAGEFVETKKMVLLK